MTLTASRLDAYLADPVLLIAEQMVIETGERLGEVIAPFQRRFFEAIFATTDNPLRPRHRMVYDERRRGEAKTEDMAAAGLADLLTGPPRHRSYAVAGDQEQAALILDAIEGFRARSPILADVVVRKNVIVNPETGSRLEVLASDAATAFGKKPRRIFFDEFSLQTSDKLWTAMWSAIGKSGTIRLSQMVIASMAGFDFSSIGWKIREVARTTPGYYFATREGSELAPWLLPEDMEEQFATLHPSDFSRFWLCKWTEPLGAWITHEMYQGAETGTENFRPITGGASYGIGVDVGLVHDATAIAVCHLEGDLGTGTVVLDTLRTMQGSRSMPVDLELLEDLVAQLMAEYGCWRVIFEAPQAVASAQRLQKRFPQGSVLARFPSVEVQAQLFGTVYHLFSSRRLRLFPHEALKKEALNLVTKTVGGRLKVVDSSAVHQDHVVALGIAAELVLTPDAYSNAMGYFGQRNADPEHQRLYQKYLADLNGPSVQAYLDDVHAGGNAEQLAGVVGTPPQISGG